MKAKLVVVGGNAKATEVNLKLPTIIGRGRDAPLTLALPLVSRQHCEIFEKNGQLVVRDLGSLNGTFINNERITEAVLPNGELLTIGTVTFRAVYDDSAAAKSGAKSPPKTRRIVPDEKTLGQQSASTVDVGMAGAPLPAVKTQIAPSAPASSKTKAKAPSAAPNVPAPAATAKPAKADAPSKSVKGSQVGKTLANQDVTLQVPNSKIASLPAVPPAKKKSWADSAADVEPVDFADADDDFELGEDEDLAAPAALPPATEFTMQITKPAGFSRRKPDDEDDFDVEEMDFSGTKSKPALPAAIAKSSPPAPDAGDLTTNFDPKILAADDKARKAAKEEAQARAAKTSIPPAKPAAKTPAVKPPVEEPEETPKKGNLSNDEDLEAFFKSLG